MAQNFWQAVSSNDWGTAGNWSGGVPDSTDDVIITKAKSSEFITGATVTAPNSLRVADDVDYAIGSMGSPLILDVGGSDAFDSLVFAGRAASYFSFTSTGGTADKVICRSFSDQQSVLNLDVATGLTIGTVALLAGRPTIMTGCALTDLIIGSVNNVLGNARVIIETGVTIANLRQIGGRCENSSAIATLLQAIGGELQQLVGNIATADILGGNVDYRSDGGTVTLLNAHRGNFDMSREGTAKTITNCNIFDGNVDIRNGAGGANVTFTNAPKRFGSGQLLQAGSAVPVEVFGQ